VVKEEIPPAISIQQALKSGVILCQLINIIKPGAIKEIRMRNVPYYQMASLFIKKHSDLIFSEPFLSFVFFSFHFFLLFFSFVRQENIQSYLKACRELGMRNTDLFDTPDLFDSKNVNLVITHLHVLGKFVKKVPGYTGPVIEDSLDSRNLFSASLVDDSFSSEVVDAYEDLPPNQREIVDWVNDQFEKRPPGFEVGPSSTDSGKRLQNLRSDMKSGVVLLELVELLTKTSVGSYVTQPKMVWDTMQNSSLVLKTVSAQLFTEITCCTPFGPLFSFFPLPFIIFFVCLQYSDEHPFRFLLNRHRHGKC